MNYLQIIASILVTSLMVYLFINKDMKDGLDRKTKVKGIILCFFASTLLVLLPYIVNIADGTNLSFSIFLVFIPNIIMNRSNSDFKKYYSYEEGKTSRSWSKVIVVYYFVILAFTLFKAYSNHSFYIPIITLFVIIVMLIGLNTLFDKIKHRTRLSGWLAFFVMILVIGFFPLSTTSFFNYNGNNRPITNYLIEMNQDKISENVVFSDIDLDEVDYFYDFIIFEDSLFLAYCTETNELVVKIYSIDNNELISEIEIGDRDAYSSFFIDSNDLYLLNKDGIYMYFGSSFDLISSIKTSYFYIADNKEEVYLWSESNIDKIYDIYSINDGVLTVLDQVDYSDREEFVYAHTKNQHLYFYTLDDKYHYNYSDDVYYDTSVLVDGNLLVRGFFDDKLIIENYAADITYVFEPNSNIYSEHSVSSFEVEAEYGDYLIGDSFKFFDRDGAINLFNKNINTVKYYNVVNSRSYAYKYPKKTKVYEDEIYYLTTSRDYFEVNKLVDNPSYNNSIFLENYTRYSWYVALFVLLVSAISKEKPKELEEMKD